MRNDERYLPEIEKKIMLKSVVWTYFNYNFSYYVYIMILSNIIILLCYVNLILTRETFSLRLLFKVPSNDSTST